MTTRPIRVARVIARLNVGGPARHVALATVGLRPDVETTLFTGTVQPGEAEAVGLTVVRGDREGPPSDEDLHLVRVPGLGRAPSPAGDLRALGFLVRAFRRLRPDVVHTHTAKAGTLGRLAARFAGVPHVVHTFHGHVFDGYFGAAASKAIVVTERLLARRTDRIVAVSDEVARDLVETYRVAPRDKVRVVPVGLFLEPFRLVAEHRGERAAVRAALGVSADAPVAAIVGRVVPVKDVALALDAWRRVRAVLPDATLLVAGDGSERAALEARGDAGVRFLGWRDDVPLLWLASDLALLTSRNEGTPVALIEAAASRVPAVATRVGGVPSVVEDGVTGRLVASRDPQAVADAVVALLRDPAERAAMGDAAQRRALERFPVERMLRDLRALYAELVGSTE